MGGDGDEAGYELNQHERERVIELLLSQERVIALLYEKTFPMTSLEMNEFDGQNLQNPIDGFGNLNENLNNFAEDGDQDVANIENIDDA